ncbi:MAG: ThiF family adenylyltransferase [Gammaproteobacteria bacterium]|nr:ThiF family adenylyltransferase [Gammaproteobacteria bacterium]
MSADSELRYSRHLALTGFTPATQTRLSQSSVLLIGLGGLGCKLVNKKKRDIL